MPIGTYATSANFHQPRDTTGQASIFVTVDHASTECLGIHAVRRATRFEALEPLRQGVRSCFGAFAAGIASGLSLRHDHGSQFVADDYQRELACLASRAHRPSCASPPAGPTPLPSAGWRWIGCTPIPGPRDAIG